MTQPHPSRVGLATRPRFVSSGRLVSVVACLALVLGVGRPAAADDALSAKWKPALDDFKGEHGWLGKWMVTESCANNGLAGCGRLADVLAGKTPTWPQDYLADSLKVEQGMGRNSGAQSAVCIPAFGCDLLDFTLEMLAASGKPEAGKLLLPWLADEAHWKSGPMVPWRGMFIRLLGWWGDKAQAPLVAQMAGLKSEENLTPAVPISAAAYLLAIWKDKSLLATCSSVWAGEVRGDALEDAKRGCAFYAIGLGELADKAKIAEFGGTSALNVALRALVGDGSQQAQWKKEAEPLKKQPDNSRAVSYAAGLAALGDKAAAAALLGNIKTCKANAVHPTAKIVMVLQPSKFAAEARRSLAGCLSKLGDSDIEGRALAQSAYALLRAGDASAAPAMIKALSSADKDVVAEAADLLSGEWGSVGVSGHSSGANGGVPAKGIGAAIAAALQRDLPKGVKVSLQKAWAMQRAHGGN